MAAAYGSNFNAISEPQPGIREWLHALSKSNVPCAIVTAFDRYEKQPFTPPTLCWTQVMTCESRLPGQHFPVDQSRRQSLGHSYIPGLPCDFLGCTQRLQRCAGIL